MTPTSAITVLTTLLNDAIRRRDDRANQFTDIHFTHLHPSMQEYYRNSHDDAVAQVEALTLAIAALQNTSHSSTT